MLALEKEQQSRQSRAHQMVNHLLIRQQILMNLMEAQTLAQALGLTQSLDLGANPQVQDHSQTAVVAVLLQIVVKTLVQVHNLSILLKKRKAFTRASSHLNQKYQNREKVQKYLQAKHQGQKKQRLCQREQ